MGSFLFEAGASLYLHIRCRYYDVELNSFSPAGILADTVESVRHILSGFKSLSSLYVAVFQTTVAFVKIEIKS